MGGRGSGGGGGRSGAGSSVKLNLSGMQGTEKQVAWATDILEGYFSTYDRAINGIKNDIRYEQNKEYTDTAKNVIKELGAQKNKEISSFNTGIKERGLKASTVIERRSSFQKTTQAVEENVLRKMGVRASFSVHIPRRKK